MIKISIARSSPSGCSHSLISPLCKVTVHGMRWARPLRQPCLNIRVAIVARKEKYRALPDIFLCARIAIFDD